MLLNRIKKYLIFVKSGIQTSIAYRGMVVLFIIGGIIETVLMGLLWWSIFNYSPEPEIGGLKFPQMLMYVILSSMISEWIYSNTFGSITDDVRDGMIGMRLIKPVNYRAQLCFTTIGNFLGKTVLFALPLLTAGTLIAVFGFGLEGIEWYNILLFLPAVFFAMLLEDTIAFIFGQLTFKTQMPFGLNMMKNILVGFLSGAFVPLALFPEWAQAVLAYTPFPSVTSTPVLIFLGRISGLEILKAFGIAAAWIAILNIIAGLWYKASVRRVVVFGG